MNVFTVFNVTTDEWICIFHGREKDLIESLDDGTSYVAGAYPYDRYEFINGEPVEKTVNVDLLEQVRMIRNSILSSSDWTQLPDANVDKQAWADYRQALRDLPSQYPNLNDISEVVWPEQP